MKRLSIFKMLKSPYVVLSIIVLFVSSLVWSILGARLQNSNADQLINSHLFQDLGTFNGAMIPNAHTFLIKWPLFLFLRIFNHADLCLIILTVLASLATVGGFAYILYRIDRRPMMFGSLLLALSGVLLLVPAQSYSGGLLPVNLAMLTTRNIEYLFYLVSMILLIRTTNLRSWQFICSLIILSALVSSDRLFLFWSIGGALVMITIYGIWRKKQFVILAFRWLLLGILAGIMASALSWILTASGLTNIVGQADSAPYAFIGSLKQLGLGVIFAVLGVLTNFGANPIFDIGIVKDMPSVFMQRLTRLSTISFLVNGALFAFGLFASWKLFIISSYRSKSRSKIDTEAPLANMTISLSIILICSSLTAIIIFILTDHYYAVDARYLTIAFFALFVAIATYMRSRPLPSRLVVRTIAIILLVGIVLGTFWTLSTHRQQAGALENINRRNQKIADILKEHKADVLVGDYWRVLPIIHKNNDIGNILPLGSCTSPRMVLSSAKWQYDLSNHSFAYLLSLDKSLTDYPQCSIGQVVSYYGQPSSSNVIAGTSDNPFELLLFYDKGISSNIQQPADSSLSKNIIPVDESSFVCKDGVTVMNIVAHQDDDLLFMSPNLMSQIDAGYCVRTVYLTAGDAGQNSQYWLGRERGAEAAYSSLLGTNKDEVWPQTTIKLANDEFIAIANPKDNTRISLIFMHLPDGNINGEGFNTSKYESLAGLMSGRLSVIHSVDGQSNYTSDQLIRALLWVMNAYEPSEVNALAPSDMGRVFHDHSDHVAVGQYAQIVQSKYIVGQATPARFNHYVGYPIHERPENITGNELNRKLDAFLAYGKFDGATCSSVVICKKDPAYWSYLNRSYTVEQFNGGK